MVECGCITNPCEPTPPHSLPASVLVPSASDLHSRQENIHSVHRPARTEGNHALTGRRLDLSWPLSTAESWGVPGAEGLAYHLHSNPFLPSSVPGAQGRVTGLAAWLAT